MPAMTSVASTSNSSCELTENNITKNPTHDEQPTNIHENETFKEGADHRNQRLRFDYFPGRSTDVDFATGHMLPVSNYPLDPQNPQKFVKTIQLNPV